MMACWIARSVYPNLECFGNGLLYAYEPWSGHYEADPEGSCSLTKKMEFLYVFCGILLDVHIAS